MTSPTGGRKTRLDWIEAAYAVLATHGERGITVNGLSARLGVTKGSFYWHFTDRAALVQAVLDRWAFERTDELVAPQLADLSHTGPAERLRAIAVLGREVAPVDRAMRLWAQHDDAVAEAVRHADETLVGHLTECLVALGLTAGQAEVRANLMLRASVGGYFVTPSTKTDFDTELALFLLPSRLPPR